MATASIAAIFAWKFHAVHRDVVEQYGWIFIVVAVGLLFQAGRQLAVVRAWLSAPAQATFEESSFVYGDRRISYADIVGLREDIGRARVVLRLRSEEVLVLYWSIWSDCECWLALLAAGSLPMLLAAAWQRMSIHGHVSFTEELRVNRQLLHLRDGDIRWRDVAFIDVSDGNHMGASYRTIRMGTRRATYEVDWSEVDNPHVFLQVARELMAPP